MPPSEIRAVLEADPIVARRYLELHAERLEERLLRERRRLADIERLLSLGASEDLQRTRVAS